MSDDNAAPQFRSASDIDIDFLFRALPFPQTAWREMSEPGALCVGWGLGEKVVVECVRFQYFPLRLPPLTAICDGRPRERDPLWTMPPTTVAGPRNLQLHTCLVRNISSGVDGRGEHIRSLYNYHRIPFPFPFPFFSLHRPSQVFASHLLPHPWLSPATVPSLLSFLTQSSCISSPPPSWSPSVPSPA